VKQLNSAGQRALNSVLTLLQSLRPSPVCGCTRLSPGLIDSYDVQFDFVNRNEILFYEKIDMDSTVRNGKGIALRNHCLKADS
jgi:hypothetical protein